VRFDPAILHFVRNPGCNLLRFLLPRIEAPQSGHLTVDSALPFGFDLVCIRIDTLRNYLLNSDQIGVGAPVEAKRKIYGVNRPLKKSAVRNDFLSAQLSGFGFVRLVAESMLV
jgi:hypothetical protein